MPANYSVPQSATAKGRGTDSTHSIHPSSSSEGYSNSINVASATSSTQLVAANPSRREVVISNDSTSKLYVLIGSGTASSSNFTYVVGAGNSLTLMTTGQITGVWASANGSAAITEVA